MVLVSDGDDSIANRKLLNAAAKRLPRTRVVALSDWVGYGPAVNRGVEAAREEFLVFLNTDTFPDATAPRVLVDALKANVRVGVAQGLLVHPQTFLVQSTGHIFSPFMNRHALMGRRIDEAIVRQRASRQALTSAFYATRRSTFLAAGGFDEWYWNSHEGMEYSLKLTLEGMECVFEPNARAFHAQGGTRRAMWIDEEQQIARFWSRWGDRIQPDIGSLLASQLPVQMAPRYLRVEIGINRSWEAVLDTVPLESELVAALYTSDAQVVLEETIAPSIAKANSSILYATNHFSQVRPNRLWLDDRRGRGDLVVDCHGNLLLADDL
jgi:hypothetical protein